MAMPFMKSFLFLLACCLAYCLAADSDHCSDCEQRVSKDFSRFDGATPLSTVRHSLYGICQDYSYDELSFTQCIAGANEYFRVSQELCENPEIDDEDLEHSYDHCFYVATTQHGANEICRLLRQCTCAQVVETESDLDPQQMHLALGETEDQMTVSWITTGLSKTPTVMYGLSETDLNMTAPANYTLTYAEGGWVGYIYHAMLSDLAVDTDYHYIVGDTNTDTWSSANFFRSAPPRQPHPDRKYRLALLGDQGIGEGCPGAEDVTNQLNSLVEDKAFDALVLAGDISYADGDMEIWDQFFDAMAPTFAQVPYMAIDGNHETDFDFLVYRYRFAYPRFVPPVASNSSSGGSPLYYSFDYGNIHFTMISFEKSLRDELDVGGAQREWLTEDLAAANANRQNVPWIVVVSHRALYCTYDSSRCTRDAPQFRALVEDILIDAKVDFVLGGHNHMYERTLPVAHGVPFGKAGNVYLNPGKPVYAVIGTGGRKKQSSFIEPAPAWSIYRKGTYGYSILQTDAQKFTLNMFDETGKEIDFFVLLKEEEK